MALLVSACGGVARAPGDGAAVGGAGGSAGTAANQNQSANGGESARAGSGPAALGGAGGTSVVVVDAGVPDTDAGNASPPPLTHPAVSCASPTPSPHGGGYVTCGDGSLRRASAAVCDEALPRSAPDMPIVSSECASDTDCKASPHGYCAYGACKYGCVMDAECASGQACFCGDFVGTCIPAQCRTDADCPAAFPCAGFQAPGFAMPDALACQSPEDECLTDAQCGTLNPRVSCKVQVDHRVCYTDPVG